MRNAMSSRKKIIQFLVLPLSVAVFVSLLAQNARAANDLLDPRVAFQLSGQMLTPTQLKLRFQIADGYYLYRDKLRFAVAGDAAQSLSPTLPKGKVKQDEFFGKVEIYRGELAIPLAVNGPKAHESIAVKVISQGCADVGVCYPPQEQTLVLATKLGVVEAEGKKPSGGQSLIDKLRQKQ